MSIKVKVKGGRNIRAIPKEGSTTPIVAPAERKPQIVPDSVVLGIDTIGPYIQRIDAGQGIIVFPETDVELANVVISHANTTTEVSSNNGVLEFTRNVDIDQFGHITQFYNTSLSSLNFTANNTLIQAKDFTIGNTSLTIGESTSTLEGLSTISVDGQSTFGSVNITDLTPARIVYVGANGELTDSNALTFDESTFNVNSDVSIIGTLNVDSQTTLSSVNVEDLTSGRITYAGTNGELVDSANLTFDGVSLTATNGVLLSGLDVTGQTTVDSINVQDLTSGRITFAGANGELTDSANLTFNGTSLIAAGAVFLDGLQVDGQADLDSVNVTDLTQGRIVYVGADGELIDSANLRFDDTSIIATGGVFLDDLSVPGQSTFGSVNILDLQEGRIMYAGANGELIDSANLFFDGVSLTATGGVFLDILEVPGQAEFGSVKVNDLTQNRVPYIGVDGALVDSNKLTFDGSTFTVDGDADITGNITIGGNIILGDAPIDTINVVADFTSDIIPDESDRYSLGTINKNWFRVYTAAIKSDTGVVKIDESGALTLPTGGTGDRPTAETGMVRFNTTDNRFEGYDGSNWSELAGSVRDVNQDTFIRAETAAGDNNDQLDFFNNGVQSLQLDSDGDFKFGAGLNKVVIDHATGDTTIQGTLSANDQVTAASLNVLDLVTSGVVTTGPQGELRSSANLAWDGTTLTIVGGITVDGDFSTSGGLSGDSLSVGNLVANTIIYVSETGALSSNASLSFDGETLAVNAHTTFSGPFFFGEIPEDRVLITGANGAVESDSGLTWDGTVLTIDGSADISGDVSIGGNLTLGNQTLDTINVVADFTSDLIPRDDSVYNLGEPGSNWDKLYINTIDADSDVVTFDVNGAVTLPTGSTAERPTPVQGMIRYNTDDGRFEAYDGSAWTGIGGVIDTDQDTFIQAESGPGSDNDELRFFTAGEERFKVGPTGVISTDDNFVFVSNNGFYTTVGGLSATTVNGNTALTGLGSYATNFLGRSTHIVGQDYILNVGTDLTLLSDQFSLTSVNVAITSSTVDIASEFISDLIPRDDATYDLGKGQVLNSNGVVIEAGQNWNTIYVRNIGTDTGVVKVTANGAFTVPVGTTLERPFPLEAGMVRFNSSDGVFEGYSGVAWASLGGVKDVDQDTYIQAESSPGADNDELEFFTAGTRRFLVSNTGAITTDPGVDLVLDIGSDNFNVGNSIITGVNAPVNSFDAVNKDYLENTYAREYWVTKAANTYALDLLDVENPAKLELGEAITGVYDTANNKVTISLDPVWQSFTGLREAGPEGFIPNFEFDEYGRVRSLINIPLSVSSNAVVDFANSIFDVVGDAVRNGNQELGITVEPDYSTSKLNFAVRSFNIDLDGAVSGTGYVQNNSNTTITTTFDFPTLDARYLNVEGGDTANGDLGATKFVDKEDTDYYVWPSNTSRIRNLIVGYGYNESSIQMSTGPTSFQYIYATGTKIGYLSNNFNFGTYFDTTNNSWRVEDGSVYSRNFIDSQNNNYLLNPAGQNSRLAGINIDNQVIIGSNLSISNNTIDNTSGDITINPASGIIDVGNSIITNLVDPVNSLDAVNKQYLEGEVTAITNIINEISANGISIAANTGSDDVVALGGTIVFAGGPGIDTVVSNNQILISGNAGGILDLVKTVDGTGSGLDADLLDGQSGAYYLDFTNATNKPDPQIDVNITGKVTGTGTTTLTDLGNGTINIAAELANTTVVPGTYGTASQIPIITVDEDGRLTAASNVAVAGVESLDWYTANNTLEIRTVDGNIFQQDIDTFDSTITANNIIVTGTVDGRDVSVDGAKLDGIEPGATADQTPAEILAALLTVDGTGTNLDADLLDGQQGTYYLDYSNFSNTPTASDLLADIKTVDGSGSGLDADLLDGLDSTQFLRSDENDTFSGDLVISGNLTVQGTTTTINTETILLSDNIITLNSNFTGPTATENAGIEVERGGETNVVLQWNETQNYWEIAAGGVTGRILTTGDEGAGNGLDADTLDGQQGSYYLDFTNATNKPDPQIDVNITGKVTGAGTTTLTDLGNGTINITAELANTAVTAGTYGSASAIPIITVDEDGRLTNVTTGSVRGVDSTDWYNANNTFQINTGDGSSFNTVINQFTGLTVDGNIVVTGTVDGRDVAADGTKLDGIESGATADQTPAEILSALLTVDGAGTNLDADLLDGQQGSYYLDYNNFTNTPPGISNAEIVQVILDNDGPGSGLDADLLDGANSTFYLDYTNFTNTPDIFNEVLANDGAGSGLDADLLDGQQGTHYLDFTNFTNIPDPQIDVTLSGKVTGTGTTTLTDLASGSITITTELANTAVTAGVYGSATSIPVITVDEDGRLTNVGTASVAGISSTDWYTSNNTFQIATGDGSVYNSVIEQFNNISANNITVAGTVDGRDVSVDGAKLDGIEAGATGDQTANEILTLIKTVDGAASGLDADLLDGQQGSYYLDYTNFTNTPSATDLLNQIKTVDGSGSGLDADTLDGLHASDITAGAVSNIGDGTVTISGSNGLTGTGNFGLNDFTNTAITIEHADTSTQVSIDNDDGNVIQDITLDDFGHITALGSVNLDSRYYTETELNNGQLNTLYYTETELDAGQLDNRYYTETELDAGQLDNRYYTETEVDTFLSNKVDNTVNVLAGNGLTGGGALTANVTISHADTSSVANTGTLDLANAEVIESVSFDEFGHVVAITTGNLAVLTQEFADAAYVNADGDTMTGDLTLPNLNANTVTLDHSVMTSAEATTSTTSSTNIWSFDAATYNSAEVIITATQGINRHITKLLVAHNGTAASATEFGTIYTNTSLANYEISLSGGNVNLSVVAANSTAITYKIAATLIID